MNHLRLSPVQDVEVLLAMASQVQELADSEKEPLGFLPEAAIREAINRRRVIAVVANVETASEFAGYLLYSGVFPHAKVQQIAVVPKYRGRGVAGALMRTFLAELEVRGFMTVRADVAADLPAALAFYASQNFQIVRERDGGKARGRTILVHVRELETDTLFSIANRTAANGLDLGLRRRSAGKSPLFALDLNIFLDLVRSRQHSDQARRLFGAALAHDIRIAVSDEFVKELRRNSRDMNNDPLLQMALNMPRLPAVDIEQQTQLREKVHDLVFVQTGQRSSGSVQALSDASHLSHAAIARASAFVTRDVALLQARDKLLLDVGIDVISLSELIDLLPVDKLPSAAASIAGDGFRAEMSSRDEAQGYLREAHVLTAVQSFVTATVEGYTRAWKITEDQRIVALGWLSLERSMVPSGRLLVHARPEHQNCALFSDFLLDLLIREACAGGPITLELEQVPGQAMVHSIARGHGFIKATNSRLIKIAMGKPLVVQNWVASTKELHRRTGFRLPPAIPVNADAIVTGFNQEADVKIQPDELENLLGPTIFVWPGRSGVIVPITKRYADELLGTSRQTRLSFIESMDASFLTKRAYVNSPKSAKLMRPDMPIIFYESKRDRQGMGAVVAVARIVDAVISKKYDIPHEDSRRLVVKNVADFSSSEDVLLTTFDNLMQLPKPVPVKRLKELDAVGRANLISPVSLPSEKIAQILAEGW
ncbi:GNAT family N-acetyltransferase [Rhizobium leguminosarum]|uniref:GNAT family N-acetyltransferase n=1 Tax=Rhizobium leguminosarum TaxID=384 RepID=UPI001C95A6EB|nr:GNAT family N-acetyltransferase [Rhizobium leguminosarum]MBY5601740.1 GNAT family N-acetyltransferase [Rhizobium leguminosarum]